MEISMQTDELEKTKLITLQSNDVIKVYDGTELLYEIILDKDGFQKKSCNFDQAIINEAFWNKALLNKDEGSPEKWIIDKQDWNIVASTIGNHIDKFIQKILKSQK